VTEQYLSRSCSEIISTDFVYLVCELKIQALFLLATNGISTLSDLQVFIYFTEKSNNQFLIENSPTFFHHILNVVELSILILHKEDLSQELEHLHSRLNEMDFISFVQLCSDISDELSNEKRTEFNIVLIRQCQRWLPIICAKCLFFGYCDVQQSYVWAKRTFDYIPRQNTRTTASLNHLEDKHRSKLLSDALTVSSSDVVLPILESVILLAELHDHSGNLDSCLSYLSEAVALTKSSHSPNSSITSLNRIVSLHSMRIWWRLSSPKLDLCLEGLLSCTPSNGIIYII